LLTWCGDGEVLRILLQRQDADPNLENWNGWTQLSWAVGLGKTSIVKMSLEQVDVNPKLVENDGWTPQGRARVHGHKDIVALI
ncbi:hypothetical protein L873DRAFT_1602080, partial [Choiromyces venosus 120613-1]